MYEFNTSLFNIVSGYAGLDKVIIRYGDVCYVGSKAYTYDSIIDNINEMFYGKEAELCIDKINELYNKNIDKHKKDLNTYSEYIIRWAIDFNLTSVIKWLHEYSIYVIDDENYIVEQFILRGDLSMIKWLYGINADITYIYVKPNEMKLTIYTAADSCNLKILKWLYRNSITTLEDYDNLLLYAITNNKFKIVKWLLKHNIGMCYMNKDHIDISMLDDKMLKLLYRHGLK